MAISKDEQKKIKTMLLEEKKDIEEKLKKMETETDFGDDTDHLEEEADETEEQVNQAGVKDVLNGELMDIDAALVKIERGGYGFCEECGREIEPAVLDVEPESRLCKNCKRHEHRS
jgi:DnaK suppressor protein